MQLNQVWGKTEWSGVEWSGVMEWSEISVTSRKFYKLSPFLICKIYSVYHTWVKSDFPKQFITINYCYKDDQLKGKKLE